MTITIDNKEIDLRYSFRALMIYEKIADKSFTNVSGLTEILIFFYSVILGSDSEMNLTWDQFIDWLDNNPNMLTEFTSWLNDVMNKNNYITNPNGEEKEVPEIDENF